MPHFIVSIGELILAVMAAGVHTTNRVVSQAMRLVLITALCIGGLLVQSSRLDLWSGPTSTFLTVAAAWATLWLSVVVLPFAPKLAGSVMTAMLVLIGLTTVKHMALQGAPHTASAVRKISSYGDKKIERAANKAVLVYRKEFACDETNFTQFNWSATDDENGQSVAPYYYAEYDGRIHCYDGPGYDSLYFHPLLPVDNEVIVRRIASQPEPQSEIPPEREFDEEPVWQAEQTIEVPPQPEQRPLI